MTAIATDSARSHRTTVLALVVLTLVSGTATRWVAALDPQTLLPWVAAFALVVAWTFRRPRTVDLFEPFTFLSWSHYAPAFVVGSALLALGVVGYPYAGLVPDPVGACALALSYTGLGYLALKMGAQWRGARALGTRLARWLPAPPAERTIPLPAIVALIALGMAANYGAFRAGIIGFAVPRAPGRLDAAVSYAGLLMTLGHFLFWFRWFSPDQRRPARVALLLPLVVVVASMVILGNRGALLMLYLHAALAFRFARGRLTLMQGMAAVALAFVALGIGMAYGSLFREIRGGESGSVAVAARDAAAAARKEEAAAPPPAAAPAAPVPVPAAPAPAPAAPAPAPATPEPAPAPAAVTQPAAAPPPSLERHLEAAAQAATTLFREPGARPVGRLFVLAGERLNLLSDASVSIARYPTLRALEPQYGIANLWTMTWTSFVPRVLWPGKPKVSDARAYAALYFNYDGNSYATTPPVDLIRNVGPFGMPLGMALFGVVLGTLSAAFLTSTSSSSVGERAALYSMLLMSINLEGSFGLLLPTMFRVGCVVVGGLVLVRLFTGRRRSADAG